MLTNRRYKDLVWEQFALLAKGLANPKRMELLDLLAQSPRTVETLAKLAGMTVANASQHLQVLKGAGLVVTERHGTFVTYRLAAPEVEEFLGSLRRLAETQLAEVSHLTRTFLKDRQLLESVDQQALVERVSRGEVTVLDVRPTEEFETGHIPGALSVPLAELKQRIAGLPAGKEIVAYCRGPYCVLAVEAVALLRSRGFNAQRLEAGVPDWRTMGFQVATGKATVPSPTPNRRNRSRAKEQP
jgi:rhodanese-related sulfurtransferase/predicted transcriptional regulator